MWAPRGANSWGGDEGSTRGIRGKDKAGVEGTQDRSGSIGVSKGETQTVADVTDGDMEGVEEEGEP